MKFSVWWLYFKDGLIETACVCLTLCVALAVGFLLHNVAGLSFGFFSWPLLSIMFSPLLVIFDALYALWKTYRYAKLMRD